MKVFFDTNVLIAAVLDDHPDHRRAFTLLERVQNNRDEGYIATHSLAEMYSTLTRMPPPFRHSPDEAILSIDENVLHHFRVLGLSPADYMSVIRDAAAQGIQGGTTYDALLLRAAMKANVDRIFTFNLKHFEQIAKPEVVALLVAP